MGLSLGKSKQQSGESAVSKFTQNAPVQTTTVAQPSVVEDKQDIVDQDPIAPSKAPIEQAQQVQKEENKYPWRDRTTMSEDELMYVKQKKSYDLPVELLLRLEYLRQHEKPKAFGQKIYESNQLAEALDEYTTRRLKALGFSVK